VTGIYHTMTLPRQGLRDDAPQEEMTLPALFDEIKSVRRVGVIMTIFAAVCVLVGLGAMLGGKRELNALADMNAELTKRANKLTAEVALKDARFQASKGVMGQAGRLADLMAIQAAIDRYALEELHNGNAQAKTADEVRREACDRLARDGFACSP
jgi:hypothetical protein